MKPEFNKTWLWIAIIIIFNITVFYFMSSKLEKYVAEKVAKDSIVNNF